MLLGAALVGCAGPALQHPEVVAEAQESSTLPRATELHDAPFFPDETYYCGPAALATILVASGVPTTASELVDAVYLPERQGSLQNELMAAARRADRVPFELSADFSDLLREVAGGQPVLVLQNLGLEVLPRWHYAVLVGYDLDAGTVTLRSGTERRETLSLRRFERTWQRGEHWAIVVPTPGHLPASAIPGDWVAAVAELERQERWSPALNGYRAAITRWPEHADAWLGLGNVRYARGEYREAADAYRKAGDQEASLAAAHHNLAWALLRLDRHEEALEAARRSEETAPDHSQYGQAVERIRAEIAE
ncbi:PA2778 family cysteine peptidase [Halorhodospira halophila]|uniref:PA2778 family cysteine peptidase n=1 Tax=Halorhodospira halophila TaxID=1053 RepID=UPI00030930DA|nr:PA2778 family cysteine peptidase [Halorhodospira halophila]